MADKKIKTSLIDVPQGRLRLVDEDWAQCLAGMFKEVGQQTPIDVIATGKRFQLVAGAHRLAAAKHLKWADIDTRILTPKGDQPAEQLRLHEILENLGRKDFNALERCEALFELKRIYELLHPETKHGGDRKSQASKNKQENQVAIFAFCQNAAETTGLSDRSVRLAVQIFEGLAPETREALKGTRFAEKQADLKTLSALDAETQGKVLRLISHEPKDMTIADALAMIKGERLESASEKLFRTISDNMVKLPKAGRLAVFRLHRDEIMALALKEGWLNVEQNAA